MIPSSSTTDESYLRACQQFPDPPQTTIPTSAPTNQYKLSACQQRQSPPPCPPLRHPKSIQNAAQSSIPSVSSPSPCPTYLVERQLQPGTVPPWRTNLLDVRRALVVKGCWIGEERVHIGKDAGGCEPVDGRVAGGGVQGKSASPSQLLANGRGSLVVM